MIVGSNQPYLFPYIGYWQLMNYVDVFVISDSMQYINKGYINRNNILVNGKKHLFTLQVMGVKSDKLINEIEVGNNGRKILSMIHHSYRKAQYFDEVFPMVEEILLNKEKNLAKYVGYSLETIALYLDMNTKFMYLSDLQGETSLKAQERTIDICKRLGADQYINAIGGKNLYDEDSFKDVGISLYFLNVEIVKYKQFNNEFVPSLSIVDILMFNSKAEIKNIMEKFSLE